MVTSSSHTTRRIVISAVLCSVLLVLAQLGLVYLSARLPSPWYWLAGTPIAYLLISGLVAFGITGGLGAAYARRQGIRFGLLAGIGGALAAALVGGVLVYLEMNTPLPPSASQAEKAGRALLGLVLVFVVPVFVAVNLLGVALASLGGMAGGQLRAVLTPTDPTMVGQPGERERARPLTGTILIVVFIALLALLIGAGAFVLLTGALPAVG
jgi:hypothetical protein